MPFGLKMSQDAFQMRMDQITDRLPGILTIHNGICVFGWSSEQHNKDLIQLINEAAKNGLVLNNNKCEIRLPEISFYSQRYVTQLH